MRVYSIEYVLYHADIVFHKNYRIVKIKYSPNSPKASSVSSQLIIFLFTFSSVIVLLIFPEGFVNSSITARSLHKQYKLNTSNILIRCIYLKYLLRAERSLQTDTDDFVYLFSVNSPELRNKLFIS